MKAGGKNFIPGDRKISPFMLPSLTDKNFFITQIFVRVNNYMTIFMAWMKFYSAKYNFSAM